MLPGKQWASRREAAAGWVTQGDSGWRRRLPRCYIIWSSEEGGEVRSVLAFLSL